MSPLNASEGTDSASTWSILGIGGVASLCCIFLAPATAAATGSALSGSATAAVGGTFIQVVVTALAVGVVAAGVSAGRRVRGSTGATDGCHCEQ
ncbi:hypothetical protein [Halorhabdus salina]|uniref:hypothetical protein n=1 Tax=Halorhabdus salina TaxID=2750670 RepID=UPI0015EE6ED6|nr:hypothetical protein [Halorhabdus salina]